MLAKGSLKVQNHRQSTRCKAILPEPRSVQKANSYQPYRIVHQNLEKRLRGSLLAVGIGVCSLLGSGCATNNPALNAFMNYGVAPVLAADAGRSQQTVVVNQDSTSVYGPQPWTLLTAETGYFPFNARGVKDAFYVDEPIHIITWNRSANRYLRIDVIDKDGKVVQTKETPEFYPGSSPPLRISTPGLHFEITPRTLIPGEYTFTIINNEGSRAKSAFTVKARPSASP